jgi:folate-dependent phosphoribosylglycinamide formyltransferase PurN
VHGCTVHQVTAGVDEGPVIGSAEVDVMPGDTSDTLAARVLKAEHLLYPRCLAAVARKGGTRVREDVVSDGVRVRLYAPRG